MLPLCIDRCVIGTRKHLVVDGGFAWVDAVPPSTWHLSGQLKAPSVATADWCADAVARLAGIELPLLPPAQFVRSVAALSGSLQGPPPWQLLLPQREHQQFVSRLVDLADGVIRSSARGYFEATWRPGTAILRALQPAHVDLRCWQELVALNQGNVPAIRSFVPGVDGRAAAISYDRFGTLTGRLTVASGPQILTLKREHRRLLRSRFGDRGSVVSIDFAALEARVLLYEHGGRCDDVDLYGAIARDVGRDRQAVKGAVISELYGSSKYALGRYLGLDGRELADFVKRIRLYFRTADLLERVKAQFVASGQLTNRYGRRVRVDEPLDHVLINYYAQSTGVDVTMLGFAQVASWLPEGAVPLFLLHDALLVDVHDDVLAEVQKINRVRVPGYVQDFYLKVERLAA